MKKIIPFLIITSFWFVGCSDDGVSANLIGTWVGTSELVTDCQDASRNGQDDLTCNDVQCYRLELGADKTYTFQRGLPIETGTWDEDGALILCVTEEGETNCESFGIQFSGVSLILIADSTSSGCVSTFFFNPETPTDTIQ